MAPLFYCRSIVSKSAVIRFKAHMPVGSWKIESAKWAYTTLSFCNNMKKTLILAGALATAAMFSAQQSHAQGIRFGLKAGANLTNLSGSIENDGFYKNKVGFVGGAMLNVGLLADGFLSLQPEVLYSQKGYKYDESAVFNTVSYSGKSTYNYIDVPVLLKLNAGGVFFEAGPQYSYLLNVKDDSQQSIAGVVNTNYTADRSLDRVNRNEIGYVAGLGFQSNGGFLLDVRYNGSFTDFAKDGYQNNDLRNARNQVFQASVGFLLPGK